MLPTTSPLYSADRVRECMNRCLDAAGQNGQRAAGDPVIGNDNFYVRKSDFRCGCAAESSAAATFESVQQEQELAREQERAKERERKGAAAMRPSASAAARSSGGGGGGGAAWSSFSSSLSALPLVILRWQARRHLLGS